MKRKLLTQGLWAQIHMWSENARRKHQIIRQIDDKYRQTRWSRFGLIVLLHPSILGEYEKIRVSMFGLIAWLASLSEMES